MNFRKMAFLQNGVDMQPLVSSFIIKSRKSLKNFFKDKCNFKGEPLNIKNPKLPNYVITRENILLVSNLSIIEAAEWMQAAISSPENLSWKKSIAIRNKLNYKSSNFEPYIWVYSTKKCSEANVPKSHCGGMVILYLEICQGLKFN